MSVASFSLLLHSSYGTYAYSAGTASGILVCGPHQAFLFKSSSSIRLLACVEAGVRNELPVPEVPLSWHQVLLGSNCAQQLNINSDDDAEVLAAPDMLLVDEMRILCPDCAVCNTNAEHFFCRAALAQWCLPPRSQGPVFYCAHERIDQFEALQLQVCSDYAADVLATVNMQPMSEAQNFRTGCIQHGAGDENCLGRSSLPQPFQAAKLGKAIYFCAQGVFDAVVVAKEDVECFRRNIPEQQFPAAAVLGAERCAEEGARGAQESPVGPELAAVRRANDAVAASAADRQRQTGEGGHSVHNDDLSH